MMWVVQQCRWRPESFLIFLLLLLLWSCPYSPSSFLLILIVFLFFCLLFNFKELNFVFDYFSVTSISLLLLVGSCKSQGVSCGLTLHFALLSPTLLFPAPLTPPPSPALPRPSPATPNHPTDRRGRRIHFDGSLTI